MRLLLELQLLWLMPARPALASNNASALVYIICHGDKLSPLGCLSATGRARADHLVDVFNSMPSPEHELFYRPTALFANYYDDGIDCERCNQTLTALAATLRLPVDLRHGYDPWLGGNSGAAAAVLDAIRRGRQAPHGDGGGVECMAQLNAFCPDQLGGHGPDCMIQCAAATGRQLATMVHALEVAGCTAADINANCISGTVPGAVVILAAWEDLGVERHLIPTWPGQNYDSVHVLQYDRADFSLTSFHTAAEDFDPNLPRRAADEERRDAIDLPSSEKNRLVHVETLKTDDAAAAGPGSYTGAPCIAWQQLLAHNVSPPVPGSSMLVCFKRLPLTPWACPPCRAQPAKSSQMSA